MMTNRLAMFCAGAVLALAGCDKKDDAAASAAAPVAAETTPAAAAAAPVAAVAAAAPAAGTAPTREFLIGKWGEAGDCTLAIDFKPDGTMDGPFEGWKLDSGELTMIGNPQTMKLTVVDQNTMESRRGGDKPRKLTRC